MWLWVCHLAFNAFEGERHYFHLDPVTHSWHYALSFPVHSETCWSQTWPPHSPLWSCARRWEPCVVLPSSSPSRSSGSMMKVGVPRISPQALPRPHRTFSAPVPSVGHYKVITPCPSHFVRSAELQQQQFQLLNRGHVHSSSSWTERLILNQIKWTGWGAC